MNFQDAFKSSVKEGKIASKNAGNDLNRFGYKSGSIQGAIQDCIVGAYIRGNGVITLDLLEQAVKQVKDLTATEKEAGKDYTQNVEALNEKVRMLGTKSEMERQESRVRSGFLPKFKAEGNKALLIGASAAYQRLIRSLTWDSPVQEEEVPEVSKPSVMANWSWKEVAKYNMTGNSGRPEEVWTEEEIWSDSSDSSDSSEG